MIERKLIPAEPSSPTRCIAAGDNGEGQCIFESVQGTDPPRCPKHHGFQQIEKKEKKKLHDYRLQIWQERLDEFTESDNVKNVRGEIGVLRILLEQVWNQCKTPQELIIYSGRLSDLTVKIEKLVSSCDRFESKMGMMLDKSAALILGSKIVELITQHVKDPVAVDAVSNGIIDIIKSLGTADPPTE